ncbi:MAG TPA: tetratricopeptide repeat protein, partial [Candidatus Solibacter sp.]|nr:tetratricopeptide repeat protein [Candidatus Solibacter sp.]
RKLALTFNATEAPDSESIEVFADESWLLHGLSWWNFGMLCAFAIGGAITSRRFYWVYGIAATYAASVVLFYVFARYRFPLVIALMLLAPASLDPWKARRWIVFVAALLATHIPILNTNAGRATHYFNIARTFAKDPAHSSDALEFYRRALATDPKFPAAQFGMATELTKLGRTAEAIPHYQSAVAAWPNNTEARYNYALALIAARRYENAITQLDEAWQLRPGDADTLAARGKALLALDRPTDASDSYRKALAIAPDNIAAITGLGVALAQSGHEQEAIEQFTRALAIDPANAAAHNSLGTALASQGHVREALPHFERAVELNPRDESAKRNLEAARAMLR